MSLRILKVMLWQSYKLAFRALKSIKGDGYLDEKNVTDWYRQF